MIALLRWMRPAAPNIFKYEYVLGHDEIAVNQQGQYTRKNNPSAALSVTMTEFRQRLEESDSD